MQQILTILNQKMANPHEHFHHADETYLYSKIFHSLLFPRMKIQLKKYLKNRKLITSDIYTENSEHTFKLWGENLRGIIEYNEENYIDEDATILNVIIKDKLRDNYQFIKTHKKIYIQYETKDHHIKTAILCEFIEPYMTKSHHSIENAFQCFNNHYVNLDFIGSFDLYAFYILPRNEEQIEQMKTILNKKEFSLPYKISDLLTFSCKEGFSVLEPNSTKKEELLKKVEEIKEVKKQQKEVEKNNQIKQIEEQLLFHLQQIDQLINSMKKLQNTNYSISKINIPDTFILIEIDNHFEINPILIPYLKYINLGGIIFNNVKVSGIDFSNTNANIIPKLVYQKDMRYGNYQGIDFTFNRFEGVNITGSLFDEGINGFQYGDEFLGAIDEKSPKIKKGSFTIKRIITNQQ